MSENERKRGFVGALIAMIVVLVPVAVFAVETDRITVEDPSNGTIKFKVTSLGNVSGAVFTGDGSGLTNVPHWKGTWSGATTYAKDDTVNYSGSSYIALQAGINLNPAANPAYWAVMASQGPQGPQGVAGVASQSDVLSLLATQANGAVLAVQQGASEAANTVKLSVKDSSGVSKASIAADGTVSTSKLSVPFNGTGTGKNVSMVNISPADNSAMLAIYPANGTNAAATMSVMPLGTGYSSVLKSNIYVYNTDRLADSTNWEGLLIRAAGADYKFISYKAGTGTIRPINFVLGSSNVLSLATNLNVGIGTTATPTQKLEVAGGVKINSSGTQPACDDATRGTFWFTNGVGSDDIMQVCAKVGGDLIWKPLW